MTIGERIKKKREELNITQEQLAYALGYKSKSSINKIEKGGNMLTQRKIKEIADALHTTPSYIMGWEDSHSSAQEFKEAVAYGKRMEEDLECIEKALADDRTRNQLLAYAKFLVNQMENEDI